MDYLFFQYLNKEKRIMGLTLDVFYPGLIFAGVVFFGFRSPITAAFLCFAWYGLLSLIKRGNPPSYLLVLAYWFLPGIKKVDKTTGELSESSILFGSIPPANKVYWIG